VEIENVEKRSIGAGFLILLGVGEQDGEREVLYLADRVCSLRIFADADGKMNLAPGDAGAEMLVISNFTLYADCAGSRRPGFTAAARPDKAVPLYELFVSECRGRGFRVETGEFGAHMEVGSVNNGPVTVIMDTDEMLKGDRRR